MLRFGTALIAGVWLTLAASLAFGQAMLPMLQPAAPTEEEAPPAATPPESIGALLDILGDPEVRSWLEARLQEARAPEPEAGDDVSGVRAAIDAALARIQTRTDEIARALHAIPGEFAVLRSDLAADFGWDDLIWSLISVGVFVVTGYLAERGFIRVTPGIRRVVGAGAFDTPGQRLRMVLLRITYGSMAVGVFILGSVVVFLSFTWQPTVETVIITYLSAFVVWRIGYVVGRVLYDPWIPNARLVPMPDAVAFFLMRWTYTLPLIAAIGWFTGDQFRITGVADATAAVIDAATGLVLALALVVAVWRWRAVRRQAGVATRKGELTPHIVTGLAPGIWLVATLGWEVLAALGTVALLLPPALKVCDMAFAGFFAPPRRDPAVAADADADPTGDAVEAAAEPAVAPLPVGKPAEDIRLPLWVIALNRAVRAILVISAAGFVIRSTGLTVAEAVAADSGVGRVAQALVDIILAYLIADLVWVVAKTAIARRMADERSTAHHGGEGVGGEGGGTGLSRLSTLLPLVRSFLFAVLVVMVVLVSLSSLGVDIGPLLAGAGVAGIAIGFGAQALVKDIVSGVFFLLDDAFRVGEYVEIDALRGTVEAISVRSLRLRHHRGAIHTIPFGEVRSMTNYSRDWVIMKLEFRVPFDTDTRLVKRLVKKIGAELQQDEVLGPSLLEPLKSQGVRRVEEFNMVIGVKFMAKPGEQFLIRREAYQRILHAFEDNGIRLASRDVQVKVDAPADADPEAVAQAVSAAAVPATERQAPAGA